MEFNCTILKPNHLYRASVKKESFSYNAYKKNYVLIVPEKLIGINRDYDGLVKSVVYIDICGIFGQNGNIYLSQKTFNFEKPTVSDIFEMVHQLNIKRSDYRYNFKTNTITKK